jgi:hypothetical protein
VPSCAGVQVPRYQMSNSARLKEGGMSGRSVANPGGINRAPTEQYLGASNAGQ